MTYEEKEFDECLICSECINNEVLLPIFSNEGQEGICDFDSSHSNKYKVVNLGSFCGEVDELFRECYGIGEEYQYFEHDSEKPSYGRKGDLLSNVVGDLLVCDEPVQDCVAAYLIDNEVVDFSNGEDGFYNDLEHYESREDVYNREQESYEEYLYENRVRFEWDDFSDLVKYKKRFFSIKSPLDEIFGDYDRYKKGSRPPIRTLEAGSVIYRARKFDAGFKRSDIKRSFNYILAPDTQKNIDEVIKNIQKELGAPPKEKAIAGRMNVQHIPAFYGAFTDDLALKEVLPSIAEEVAVAKFSLVKDIKVFDFTVFDIAFDEYYKEGLSKYSDTRYKVITQLHDKINEPVSPYDKSLDYIPTQILTEYIREHFEVDGIIFFSSLAESSEKEKRNIVIFSPDNNCSFSDVLTVSKDVKIKKINNIKYDIGEDPF